MIIDSYDMLISMIYSHNEWFSRLCNNSMSMRIFMFCVCGLNYDTADFNSKNFVI